MLMQLLKSRVNIIFLLVHIEWLNRKVITKTAAYDIQTLKSAVYNTTKNLLMSNFLSGQPIL